MTGLRNAKPAPSCKPWTSLLLQKAGVIHAFSLERPTATLAWLWLSRRLIAQKNWGQSKISLCRARALGIHSTRIAGRMNDAQGVAQR
jgi:hypothetical protein